MLNIKCYIRILIFIINIVVKNNIWSATSRAKVARWILLNRNKYVIDKINIIK